MIKVISVWYNVNMVRFVSQFILPNHANKIDTGNGECAKKDSNPTSEQTIAEGHQCFS